MKRLLRALRAALQPVAPRRAPGVASPPDPSVHPVEEGAACLDVRAGERLSIGIVTGAILLSPAEAVAHVRALPRPLRVVADSDEAALALAAALCAAGHPEVGPSLGGLQPWRAAGRAIHEPAWKSPLPPGHPVQVGPERGRVQDVRWEADEFRFDVRLFRGGGLALGVDLPEEALDSAGPRGAAGLGGLA